MMSTSRYPLKGLLKDFGLFSGLGLVAYGFGAAGTVFFPGQRPSEVLWRAGLASIGVALLLLGSRRLLLRAGFPADALGLRPTWTRLRWFGGGILCGSLIYGLLFAVVTTQVPLQWERGLLSAADVGLVAHTYFWTGWGEELLFRGYALVVLVRCFGAPKAVWVMALPFGLFHLPGMEGLAAVKMVATTAAMSLVFSYSFLLTGTLWTAVGLHLAINVWLHTLTGPDGSGHVTYWNLVSAHRWPTGYDLTFWAMIAVTSLVAGVLMAYGKKGRETPLAENGC